MTLSPRCYDKIGKSFWEAQAKKTTPFLDNPSTLYYLECEKILIKDNFKKLKGKKLLKLDLWNEANNTQILTWVAKKGAEVYGIDISSYIVKKAKENFKKQNLKHNFSVADIRKLPYKNNSFDYIYTVGTIEHVPDYNIALNEIHRVLKKHGIAIIGVPNKYDPFLKSLIIYITQYFGIFPYGYEESFSMKEFEQILINHKFKIVKKDGILFMPFVLRILDVYSCKLPVNLKPIMNILVKPWYWIYKNFKSIRKHSTMIVVVCKK